MSILKITIGVRVSEEEEIKGLDIGEHEMQAYSEGVEDSSFQLSTVD
jgi:ammonium transporter, Amt family